MDHEKAKQQIQEILADGDQWLLKHGVVTPVTHNTILINLYVNFPKVEYIDYYIHPDNREIEVNLYIPFFKLMFTRRQQMVDKVFELLVEYLKDFTVSVNLKRYKKGMKSKPVTSEKPA